MSETTRALTVVRVTDRAALDAWHRVRAASYAADHARLPSEPVANFVPYLHGEQAGERMEFWLASLDGEAVASAELRLPTLDNLASANGDVRVRPDRRRRGFGRALLTTLAGRAAADRRTRLFFEIGEPLAGDEATQAAGPAFARAAGARPVLTEIRRLLVVRELDDAALAAARAQAQAAAVGYSLVQWVDRAPEEDLDDLAALSGRMSTDAPLEDMVWEPEAWSAKRWRDEEDTASRSGRRTVNTAARDDATGRIVAVTTYVAYTEQLETAFQWMTLVAPEHRGHRLGLLIKIANLDALRAHVPGVEAVNTWNAEINEHMIAINETMGFQAVERWREWELTLAT